ncbi:MAG: energy transducer TonB, partial [Gammaproteobacteria bacterium]|nr:energy transducer TonB [Gammaproteobacteria bacterium]
MRISGRNWVTAFALAVLVHAGIAFAWPFLSTGPRTRAAEEDAVHVSLGKWTHALTVDSRETSVAPEVPVVRTREVSPSISTESSVLSEVVRGVHVQQVRDIDEAVNVLPNEDMLSEKVEPGASTEVANSADSVFDAATAVRLPAIEGFLVTVEPAESGQANAEPVESARINTLEKDIPSANREQDPLSEEERLQRAAGESSLDHSAKQEESENGSVLVRQEPVDQNLSALPQREVNPVIHEYTGYALQQEYLKVLMSQISAQKRYPNAARRRGATGVATVHFTILADGSMESPKLAESSGNRHLDKAALGM